MRPVGRLVPLLARLTAALTVLVGVVSLGTYRTGHARTVTSQFGEVVEVFGYGVHARDSVLKAGIFTGADAVCLLVGVPLLLWFAGRLDHPDPGTARRARLRMAALLGVFAYYAFSGATTQTYNVLLLPFCLMTATALFGCFALVLSMDLDELAAHQSWALPWRSVTVFLVLVLTATSLVACITVGLQTVAGVVLLWEVYAALPVAQVVTKIAVFVVLGAWGLYLDRRLFRAQR